MSIAVNLEYDEEGERISGRCSGSPKAPSELLVWQCSRSTRTLAKEAGKLLDMEWKSVRNT